MLRTSTGVAIGDREVDLLFDPFFLAVQNLVVQPLLRCHVEHRVGTARLGCLLAPLEEVDQALEGVRSPGQDQVLGELSLLRWNLGEGDDVGGVDDREIEPGAHRVVEKDSVDDLTGDRIQAEGDVGDAKDRQNARQRFLDQLNAPRSSRRRSGRTPLRRWRGGRSADRR